jgi:hypothetical protein
MNQFLYVTCFKSTNLRDLVYTILGLASCPISRMSIDYRKSVRQVFAEATETIIRDIQNTSAISQSLNTICTAYRDSDSRHNLPSWVPDWSIRSAKPLIRLEDPNDARYNAAKSMDFISRLNVSDQLVL